MNGQNSLEIRDPPHQNSAGNAKHVGACEECLRPWLLFPLSVLINCALCAAEEKG